MMKFVVLEKSRAIQNKLIKFFIENPNPPDNKVHAFAEQHGIDPDKLETEIYGILSNIISFPKVTESEVNPRELAMGNKVEMEHTSFPAIATRIALSHLAEFPDYYTRLKKMEEEAKKAKRSN